jgi:hypothetical protein
MSVLRGEQARQAYARAERRHSRQRIETRTAGHRRTVAEPAISSGRPAASTRRAAASNSTEQAP